MENIDLSNTSPIKDTPQIIPPVKPKKNLLRILLSIVIAVIFILCFLVLKYQGRIDIPKPLFIKGKPSVLVKCPYGDEQCKDRVDGEVCYPGLSCNKSGENCNGGLCTGLGAGRCFAGRCVSEKRYLAEELLLPEDFMGVFDDDFKSVLENIFQGNIKYSEIDQGIYHFEYSTNVYGIYTYLYDKDNSKMEAILGMPEKKVIFDLSKEIQTFNDLTNIPTDVTFHTFYLGTGYEDVSAYAKQIGDRRYAVYDTEYEDPRYGVSRVYFTYDEDTKQLIYIRLNFSRAEYEVSAKFLEKFEEEVL